MKNKLCKYIDEYVELVNEYKQLDSELIVDWFEDKVFYDALGYTDYFNFNINDSTNTELLEAQADLATKVNDLKMILKNIKANQKLMNRINPIYG